MSAVLENSSPDQNQAYHFPDDNLSHQHVACDDKPPECEAFNDSACLALSQCFLDISAQLDSMNTHQTLPHERLKNML